MSLQNLRRLANLKTRRKLWLEVHLWLGLVAGATLVIFGITGSILVFHQEIDELLNPKLLTIEARPGGKANYRPLEDIFAAGIRAMPADAKLTFANYPRNDTAVFRLRFQVPALPEGESENWEVAVDPYTAEVIGRRLMKRSDSTFPRTFIGFVFELHYAFFLGEKVGYALTGILGALLIISVLTGLIVWWPLTGKWLQALTIKRRTPQFRSAQGFRLLHHAHHDSRAVLRHLHEPAAACGAGSGTVLAGHLPLLVSLHPDCGW
jgi:uncharacterized iron-regulated membrane protein